MKAFNLKTLIIILSAAVLSFNGPMFAQDANITGLVYHYTGFGLKSLPGQQRVLAERNKLHLFAETETGRFTLFAELEFASDLGFLGETDVTNTVGFKEAYVNYSDDNFDARIGLQGVNWGFSNGLYGLDQLALFDLAEALTQDYATIRTAVWSGLVRYYPSENSSIDLFISPGAHAAALPDPESPWGLNGVLPFETGLNSRDDNIPDRDFSDPEIAVRFNLQSDVADYSLTYMDIFSRLPAIAIFRSISGWNVQNHYYKYQIIGGNVSTSLFDPVILGVEIAHSLNTLVSVSSERPENSTIPNGFGEKDLTNIIVSLTNSNALFDGQLALSLRSIHGYDEFVGPDQNSLGVSASLNRSLMDDKLRLEFLGLSPDFKQHWIQAGARYSFTDQLGIFGGAQFYGGEVDLQDPSFPLALYGQKDLVFVEVAYTF